MSIVSDFLLLKKESNFKLTFFMKVLLILVFVPLLFLQSNSKLLEQIYFGISVSDILVLIMITNTVLVIMIIQYNSNEEKGHQNNFLIINTIKDFRKLIQNEPSSKVTSRMHIKQAQESRNSEKESVHVLYATAGAISLYYSRSTWEWVNKEQKLDVLSSRKRFIIVEKNAISSSEYNIEIKRIIKRLSDTSDLKVLFDVDINEHRNYQELIRDFGIFKNEKNERKGFFTCAAFDEHKIFSQVPNNYYIVKDITYLTSLENTFNKLWNDESFRKLSNLRIEQIKETKVQEDSYFWSESESHLNKDSLNALHRNQIPAIRINEFATKKECEKLLNAIKNHYDEIKSINKDNIKNKKVKSSIGIATFDRYKTPITKYQSEYSVYQEIVNEAGFDPVKRILEKLEDECDIAARIVCEEKNYYAGVIRMIDNKVLIHVDLTPINETGFEMHNITNQIAWNLFLTTPRTGGDCIVYDSPWTGDYATCKVINNSVVCDKSKVEEERRFKIKPKKGDLVLFNCRNFHEVTTITEKRITVGSFMGKDINDNYLLWS